MARGAGLMQVRCVWPWACAAASGVLLTLCFPGPDEGWLVWIALTPLMAAVWLRRRDERRPWVRDALLGYVAGLVFFASVFSWLGEPLAGLFQNGWLVLLPLLLALYLAMFFAFWGWYIGLLPRGDGRFLTSGRNVLLALLAALGWVAQEWVRGWLFGGFGWDGLGVALHRNLALIQIADVAGVHGLTLLVAFANAIALITVRRFTAEIGRMRIRPHWDFTVMMAAVVAVFAYGVRVVQHPAAASDIVTLRVAALQPDVPESDKWSQEKADRIFERYDTLTRTALAWRPDLLLWPEAATLTDLTDAETFAYLKGLAAGTESSFLLGSFLSPPGEGDYNIAACMTNGGKELQVYRKMHLVPFGEYIPLRETFPLFARIAGSLVPTDMKAGHEFTVFQIPGPAGVPGPVRLAPLICFEDTLGDQTRRFVEKGAQLLVNITNDSWFGQSAGSAQHLANAVLRTVENRRPMVRDANTGITCIIDDQGRVLQKLANADGTPFLEGVLFGTVGVPRDGVLTFYTRHGDWVAVAASLVTCMVLGWRMIRR